MQEWKTRGKHGGFVFQIKISSVCDVAIFYYLYETLVLSDRDIIPLPFTATSINSNLNDEIHL